MITILGPGIGLLCRRTNDAPEFVKNCWSDVEKEAPHLRNPYDFALGMELRGILDSHQPAFKVLIIRI
jgi:hypothetical protein